MYPVVLGHDWPGFTDLIWGWSGQPKKRYRTSYGRQGLLGQPGPQDPLEGTLRGPKVTEGSQALTDHSTVEETRGLDIDGDFLEEQRGDPSLSRIWDQAASWD